MKDQYESSWKIYSSSKNNVKEIKKIDKNIYELLTEFEYFHNNKNKTMTVTSRVMYRFDNNGKIIEIYGI